MARRAANLSILLSLATALAWGSLLCGCSSAKKPPPRMPPQTTPLPPAAELQLHPETMAVYEAVTRGFASDVFEENAQNIRIVFLGLTTRSADPPPSFFQRVRGMIPAIRPISQAQPGSQGIEDKVTGEPGIILVLQDIRWINSLEAVVQASWYQVGPVGHGFTAWLLKRDGRWELQ